MKVYLNPTFDGPDRGEGGIRQVVMAQKRYLPDLGVEFVNTPDEAEIANCHITNYVNHPRLVLSVHGLHWKEDQWEKSKFTYNTNNLLIEGMRLAKVVTVPSRWVANAIQRGMLVDPVVVNHGIEISEWEPKPHKGYVLWAKNREDFACPTQPMQILASLAPDIQFLSTFGEETPNVSLLGRLSHPHMKDYVETAGVYLATPRETFGIGMIEALACGVPVLGWKWGGQEEIITHLENGYLAEIGDYRDLLDGLHYCLNNRDRLSANARQTVIDQYQWKDVIGGYLHAYEKALRQTQHPVKVSVILPCYNLGAYLERAVQSVQNQRFTDWEIVIVNDASTDNSGEIADKLAAQDSRIRVIHNATNQHVSESRNIGMRAARGEYLIALDPDDQLGGDALGVLSRSLDRDLSLQIVTGAMQVVNEAGEPLEQYGPQGISGWPPEDVSYQGQIEQRNQVPYASLFRREVFERTGGYRRRIRTGVEDADFWTRAMSYGFRAKKVSNYPTLIYTMRNGSLSHTRQGENWLVWYPWHSDPDLTPFGATDYADVPVVPSYNPLEISVIVPCGPGHEKLLQDCLDSLSIQTFYNFEVIVVNDTGQSWEGQPYLDGFPFVRVVQTKNGPRGAGHARNTGIATAKAPLFVLLDADDYAQPAMLETLYKAWKLAEGGWVYCDWYTDTGTDYYHDEAKDWSAEGLVAKSLSTAVGLYSKGLWKRLGGFDEKLMAGEDWDFQLSLLEQGVCGTRVAIPLFTYRHRTGERRENGFNNLIDVLKYIRDKHTGLEGEKLMGCSSCGGGGGRRTVVPSARSTANSLNVKDDELVLMNYVGTQPQKRHLRSKVDPQTVVYEFSQTEPKLYVLRGDVAWMENTRQFARVTESPKTQGGISVEQQQPVKAEYTPVPDQPINTTSLDRMTVTILKENGFTTVNSVKLASDAMLLKIKGISTVRLAAIRAAVG